MPEPAVQAQNKISPSIPPEMMITVYAHFQRFIPRLIKRSATDRPFSDAEHPATFMSTTKTAHEQGYCIPLHQIHPPNNRVKLRI